MTLLFASAQEPVHFNAKDGWTLYGDLYGKSPRAVVLAAIRFLQGNGAKLVAIAGAGMGGNLAEEALRLSQPGEIDRIVFLAHGAYGPAQALKVRKLFIDTGPGNVPRLTRIQAQYDQAGRLTSEMIRFLTAL